jgi:hypothetical protein
MISDLEMKFKDLPWYSPIYIERYLHKEYKKVGLDVFNTSTKYQKAREIKLGRILALCLNAMKESEGQLHFVSLPPSDPPDICVVGKKLGTKDIPLIYAVEETTYIGEPKQSIVDHLVAANKTPSDHHNLGEKEVLLINIGIDLNPDLCELRKYLISIKAPYGVWTLQDVSRDGDTIALFTEVHPDFRQIEVNVGFEAVKLQSKTEIERITLVRSGPTKSGTIDSIDNIPEKAPWE